MSDPAFGAGLADVVRLGHAVAFVQLEEFYNIFADGGESDHIVVKGYEFLHIPEGDIPFGQGLAETSQIEDRQIGMELFLIFFHQSVSHPDGEGSLLELIGNPVLGNGADDPVQFFIDPSFDAVDEFGQRAGVIRRWGCQPDQAVIERDDAIAHHLEIEPAQERQIGSRGADIDTVDPEGRLQPVVRMSAHDEIHPIVQLGCKEAVRRQSQMGQQHDQIRLLIEFVEIAVDRCLIGQDIQEGDVLGFDLFRQFGEGEADHTDAERIGLDDRVRSVAVRGEVGLADQIRGEIWVFGEFLQPVEICHGLVKFMIAEGRGVQGQAVEDLDDRAADGAFVFSRGESRSGLLVSGIEPDASGSFFAASLQSVFQRGIATQTDLAGLRRIFPGQGSAVCVVRIMQAQLHAKEGIAKE